MRELYAGLRPVLIIVAIIVAIVTSCGGSTTTITEEIIPTPQPTDPAVITTFGAFVPDGHGDQIFQEVKANGVIVNDGDKITVNRTRPVVHVTDAIYGLGVYNPETKSRQQLNITDVEVDDENLCSVGLAWDTVHSVLLDPTSVGQVVYDIDLSSYQEPNRDVEIVISVTGKANPELATVWTARNLGLKPMPSTGQTVIRRTIVTKKNDGNWWVLGVLGVAVAVITGNPGVGVAVFCGDPTVTTMFTAVIPASGDEVTPPPPPTITMSLSGPIEGDEGTTVQLVLATNCTSWKVVRDLDGLELAAGSGNDSIGVLLWSVTADTLVTFTATGCGKSDSHQMWIRNVTTPPANEPPNAVLTASPSSGIASLSVTLDASGSTDSDGTIVKYEWDYEGNGTWDFDSGTDAVVSHLYTVGTWTPKVRVTDNDGATDTASATTITVDSQPVDEYDGATVFITPQDPFLDPVVGDEQQFVQRIYAADGLTELPVPNGATIAWSSNPVGAVTQTGYFYSVFGTPGGSGQVMCQISWSGHELVGSTAVYFVPAG